MQVTKLQMIAQWMEGADNLGNDWTGKGFDGWAVQLGNTTPLAGGLFYVMAGYADGDYASTFGRPRQAVRPVGMESGYTLLVSLLKENRALHWNRLSRTSA